MKLNKVLIITNPLNHEGGVVNYYNLFFKHFTSESFRLKHHAIGSMASLFYYPLLKRILYPFIYLYDILKYILLLVFDRKIKIVQVSPSLIPVPLIRDGLLVILAKLFDKKVIVFYRGWKLPVYHKINNTFIFKKMFNTIFQSKTQQIVLATAFKDDLLTLRPKLSNNVHVAKTTINKRDIIAPKSTFVNNTIDVLFLGRVQDLKGINELVEAICQLKKSQKLKHFKFTIAGNQNRLGYIDELKETLKKNDVTEKEVCFVGRVDGKAKYELYAKNDIYVLPSYTEGCPNSVLEALASGLFCITTPVGALSDLIIPKKNGLLVNVKNVSDIVNALLYVLENNNVNCLKIINAKKYSELFDIRIVVKEFEKMYHGIIK